MPEKAVSVVIQNRKMQTTIARNLFHLFIPWTGNTRCKMKIKNEGLKLATSEPKHEVLKLTCSTWEKSLSFINLTATSGWPEFYTIACLVCTCTKCLLSIWKSSVIHSLMHQVSIKKYQNKCSVKIAFEKLKSTPPPNYPNYDSHALALRSERENLQNIVCQNVSTRGLQLHWGQIPVN